MPRFARWLVSKCCRLVSGAIGEDSAGPAACGLAAAAVRPGDDLEQVAIGVFEVQASATVTVVDRPAPGLGRICPVRQILFTDAAKGGVELFLADEKRVVLGRDFPACLGEIQRYIIAIATTRKWPKRVAGGKPRIPVRNAADRCWS